MLQEELEPIGHVMSLGALSAVYFSWITPVAAAVGAILVVVFYVLTICQMPLVKKWHTDAIVRRRTKKLARLRASEKLVLAKIQALEKKRAGRVEARELIADAAADAAQLVVHAATEAKK
jgi:hypothetical protein